LKAYPNPFIDEINFDKEVELAEAQTISGKIILSFSYVSRLQLENFPLGV